MDAQVSQMNPLCKPRNKNSDSPVTEALAFAPTNLHLSPPGQSWKKKETVLPASSRLSGEVWSPAEGGGWGVEKKKKGQLELQLGPAKIRVHECTVSRVRLFVTPWTVAHHTPLSMQFSRQEYWRGLPFPSPF